MFLFWGKKLQLKSDNVIRLLCLNILNHIFHLHAHLVSSSSRYLERFQVDFLHCQTTIFCEELHTREKLIRARKQRGTVKTLCSCYFP